MMTEYKIDLRHQVMSFRECFVTLAWTMVALILGPFLIKGMDYGTMFVICMLVWLVTSFAITIPFHVNYLIANWQSKLIVDDGLKTIKLIQSGVTFDYKFSDIKVTQCVVEYYRPDRTYYWAPIPFGYYGYLKIRTNDSKEFYLTSLMIDPFKPPLPVDKTEDRYPIIWG